MILEWPNEPDMQQKVILSKNCPIGRRFNTVIKKIKKKKIWEKSSLDIQARFFRKKKITLTYKFLKFRA